MVALLTSDDVAAAIPNLPDPWAGIFLESANSAVARIAPCLVVDGADEGLRAEAQLVVLRAIKRVHGTPTFATSETRGPFSITYLTAGRGLLDGADVSVLAGLCGGASGLPRGAGFPPPLGYGRIFPPVPIARSPWGR